MTRKELSFFLKNIPGELGRLAALMKDSDINIEALSIQDAAAYVKTLHNARGKSLKRIASTASYSAMLKDSAEFALVRFIVDKPDEAVKVLADNNYIFEINPVIAVHLENTPGKLAEITSKLGEMEININYIYGSVAGHQEKCLFVLHPENTDQIEEMFTS